MDEHVKNLYDLEARARAGQDSMREALRRNLVDEYHRTVRETPEYKLAPQLSAIKRHINELATLRRQLSQPAYHTTQDVRHQVEIAEITESMTAIAHGTVMWANEQLGREVVPQPQSLPTQPAQPMVDNTVIDSGEVA